MNQIVRKTSGLTFFLLKVAVIIFIMFSVMGFLAETAARMRMRLPQPFRGAAVLAIAVASTLPFVRGIEAAKHRVMGIQPESLGNVPTESEVQGGEGLFQKVTYFDLFKSAWERGNYGPSYATEQALRAEIDRSRQTWQEGQDSAIWCDDLVMQEAIHRGLTKEQTLTILQQSLHLEELGKAGYALDAREEYLEGLALQFDTQSQLSSNPAFSPQRLARAVPC